MEQRFHVSEEQLEHYVRGRLSKPDVEVLEEHLLMCESCQDRLDDMEDFVLGMTRQLQLEPLPAMQAAPRKDWFAWLRKPAFAMAVAFAALIILAGIVSTSGTKFAPTASLQLTAMRGEMPFTVPARQFDITLKDSPTEGGPYRVAVVNEMGVSLWTGVAPAGPEGVHVNVTRKLEAGDYYVRIYRADGSVLHEYGFRVHA